MRQILVFLKALCYFTSYVGKQRRGRKKQRITIDGGQQAEQWTQQKGWYEEDWTDAADGGKEEQGYW